MDTMNATPRLSLADEAVVGPVDPRTGTRLRPLGVTRRGRLIWPIMGGAPDDDSTRGGDDDKDKDEDVDKDDPDKDKSSGEPDADKDKGNPDAKITALEEEKDRQYRRRREAETKAERLERELAELKAKDTPEAEQVVKERDTLRAQVDTLTEQVRETRLENAFLQDNTYSWHNPGRALRLADLSKVEIDDDGTVHGLKDALDALAKSDGYLLKQDTDKDDKKKDDKDKKVSTDQKNKSKKSGGDESAEAERKRLHSKYPALRR